MHSADTPLDSRGRIQISGSIPGPTQKYRAQFYSAVRYSGGRGELRQSAEKEISSRWRAEGFIIPSRSGVGTLCIDRSEGVTPCCGPQ